jgi:hypothetical protein
LVKVRGLRGVVDHAAALCFPGGVDGDGAGEGECGASDRLRLTDSVHGAEGTDREMRVKGGVTGLGEGMLLQRFVDEDCVTQ